MAKKAKQPAAPKPIPSRVRVVKFASHAEAWIANGVNVGDELEVMRGDHAGPIGTLRVWVKDPAGKMRQPIGCLLVDEFEVVAEPAPVTAEAMFDALPEVPVNRREQRSPESFETSRRIYAERYAVAFGVPLSAVSSILLDDGSILVSSNCKPTVQFPEDTSAALADIILADAKSQAEKPQELGGYRASQLAAWYGANGYSLEETERALGVLGFTAAAEVIATHYRKGARAVGSVVAIPPGYVATLEAATVKKKKPKKEKHR